MKVVETVCGGSATDVVVVVVVNVVAMVCGGWSCVVEGLSKENRG